jgi:hypothetical protein
VSYYTSGGSWELESASIAVRGPDNAPVPSLTDLPYGQNTVNSGHWLQVVNPSPGSPYSFTIETDVREHVTVNADGYAWDVGNWGFNTTYYTKPTYPYIPDLPAGSPQVQGAIDADASDFVIGLTSFLDPSFAIGVQNGVRGDLERLGFGVGGHMTWVPGSATGAIDQQASATWELQRAECGGMTNVTVALQRRYGVPARCALVGVVAGGFNGLPEFGPRDNGLHALGEVWDGYNWEPYEPYFFTNIANSKDVWLGSDQDFATLALRNDPAGTEQSFDYSTSLTVVDAGGMTETDTRCPSMNPDLFGAIPARNQQQYGLTVPHDSVGPAVGIVSVGGPPRGNPRRFSVAIVDQVSRGNVILKVEMPIGGQLEAELLDVMGRRVDTITHQVAPAGNLSIVYSRPNLSCGVYFVRATLGEKVATTKVVYLRQ